MRARVVVFAREGAARERLRAALEARGAEVVVAGDPGAASRALRADRVAGMIVDLDPSPYASGLALLLAVRDRHPAARRVLLVDGHASIADAAFAAGLADRVLAAAPDRHGARVFDAIADWLVAVCEHAPRRPSASLPAGA